MSRPRLLDLFCGAGGAAMGYHRAGFDVVGVDINPQPHYPFEFIRGDALTFARADSFDAIHASPPCQAYSVTRHSHSKSHPELIDLVRSILLRIGKPWVMENVVGAPLRNPFVLCGTMFDLRADDPTGPLFLRRHRLFESSHLIFLPRPCRCVEWKRAGIGIGGVYGGGSSDRTHAKLVRRGGYTPAAPVRRELMGIDWTTQDELSQAIPPAFTEHIGRQLMTAIEQAA